MKLFIRFIKQNINKFLVLVIYILVFYVLSDLLYNVFANYANTDNKKMLFTVIVNIIIYCAVFVPAIILLNSELKTDFNKLCKTKAITIFGVCGIGLGASYLGNFIGSTIIQILNGADTSINQSSIEQLLFSKYAVIMIILVVIIGPIVEELVFRKSLHNFFRNIQFPSWLILIISSVTFGFIHVLEEGDYIQVFPYIFMGLALGGIEIYSKNIYPSIITHIIINAVATVSIYYNAILELIRK